MKIKEVEKVLGTSRANIRFYEKEKLLEPERKENGYREYTDKDVEALKQIIILRKLGLAIPDIREVREKKQTLRKALDKNIDSLQAQIDELSGALKLCRQMKANHVELDDFDADYYWNQIQAEEKEGRNFANVARDYLLLVEETYGNMWKYVFFYDFKKDRKIYGLAKAVAFTLFLCIARGIGKQFLWKTGTFWEGFSYPFLVFITALVLILPLYVLSKRKPQAAAIVFSVLLYIIFVFFAFLALLIIVGIINSVFHLGLW